METENRTGYKIRFLSGDLEGRSFAVRNAGTTIGRSRSADIRPGADDIAGEHVSLLPQLGGGVLLHNPGNGPVSVKGAALVAGQEVLLHPGDDVSLGKTLAFLVEEDDSPVPATAAAAEPDPAD